MLDSLFSLKGKIALITGSTQGLGMIMAEGLGAAGAILIINGNSSLEKINKVVNRFRSKGYECYGYKFNIEDERAVNENISTIENEVGDIDVLVNNAGIIARDNLIDTNVDTFKSVININLIGSFVVSKRVAKKMIFNQKGGKIINVCSLMSELGRESVGAYAASKGGLKMLTKNMATEWAKFNIQVNGIGPGYFMTSMTNAIRIKNNPFYEFIVNRTPAGYWGDPVDLVGTTIFLSSNASNYVNGQIIYVDGGILCSL